jgi:hypothetical protein
MSRVTNKHICDDDDDDDDDDNNNNNNNSIKFLLIYVQLNVERPIIKSARVRRKKQQNKQNIYKTKQFI